MRCLGALLGMALVAAACGSGGVESRLAGDSDEDDHEQSELRVGGDDCEASDQADEARATGDIRVWDVIDADREGGLCVNDPAVLAAFDAEISVIDEPGDLADVRDDVVTVFADGYIDAAKRDELLDRLSEVESGLRGESGTADTGEEAILEIETTETSKPETDIQDDVPPTIQTVLDDVEVATGTTPGTTTTTTEATPGTTTTTQPALGATPPASLASGIALTPLLFPDTEKSHDRDTVPRSNRIVVSPPDADGTVTVHGNAAAVPVRAQVAEWTMVRVISVEWGTWDCVERQPDGSFDADLVAPTGSTLYVVPVRRDDCSSLGGSTDTGPAAVLTVPGNSSKTQNPGSYVTSGSAGSELKWSAQGSLIGPGRSVEFVVHDGPGEQCLVPSVFLYRLFDSDGGYLTQVNVHIHGPVLTPTGLPIESIAGSSSYYEIVEFVDAPDCLRSTQTLTPASLPLSLEPGWYLPRIMFGLVQPNEPTMFMDRINTPLSSGGDKPFFEGRGNGYGYLPMFSVGGSATPRLPATLLNETPSWGSAGIRGVVADEDSGRFALGSRRSMQAPFIASRLLPYTGQLVRYSLEPYLPTVGYTGFGARMPEPLFTLDADDPGQVSISLTTPDGTERVLAQDAPVQMFVAAGSGVSYPVELTFAGPNHTVGLTTLLDDLDLEFDQYGRHSVRVDGTLLSSRGDEFVIEGTYDIWVAEPLDLSLGVFEGTPLEVGDEWNPTVVVEPGVPADITIDIAHYVDGDRDKRRNHTITGAANRFGYFASDQVWRPTEHGEYRIDVTASYVDPVDGTLWMGARSTASIVATPDTPLTAHGSRSESSMGLTGDLRTWFFARSADPGGSQPQDDHTSNEKHNYPFFTGDIVWITDLRPIFPIISVDGPDDVLAGLAPQLVPQGYCLEDQCVEASDTHFLASDLERHGGSIHLSPDDVTSWGYWYSTSIRADVGVFHAVAEQRGGKHTQWYGNDSYNCQIGLPCGGNPGASPKTGGRPGSDMRGDEEGDVKLLFGGAVLKNGDEQHFVPYASMGVIIEESTCDHDDNCTFGDDKGGRVCPPYQGAVGGVGTCGPLLTHRGRDVDLFITPTGTRPGSVLEPGDLFTFSGQAWPTLDVAVEVTVTGPDGETHQFENRANTVGYVDAEGMSFVVEESGVYQVHVSAIQDRPVPSTGLAPDPALVADGRITMDVYGYEDPLSAVLGSEDSTYHFYVVDTLATTPISSRTVMASNAGGPIPWATRMTFTHDLPPGVAQGHYSLTAPGLLIDQGTISGSGTLTVEVDQSELYETGFTQIILGADTLQLSIAYQTETGWQARTLNQRGFSPLGG